MRIKVFQAVSITLAMLQIRDELGLNALILSTAITRDGVEVTAAIEVEDELELVHPLPVLPSIDFVSDDIFERYDAQQLFYKHHNLPDELVVALNGETTENACARLFRFGDIPLFSSGPPLMLVGPPGSGKTLTVAKLATRLVLNGATPLVITTDDQRAGAVEQLAAFTRLLGLTLIAASGPETLNRALLRRQQDSPVLIDSPGFDLAEPSQAMALSELISASRAHTTLVLPAGVDPQEAVEIAEFHATLGTCHLLPTRLDRNGRLGGILAAAMANDLILTEAGVGTAVAKGLERLSPSVLSHRLHLLARPVIQSVVSLPIKSKSDLTVMLCVKPQGSNVLSAHIAAQAGLDRPTPWKTTS